MMPDRPWYEIEVVEDRKRLIAFGQQYNILDFVALKDYIVPDYPPKVQFMIRMTMLPWVFIQFRLEFPDAKIKVLTWPYPDWSREALDGA
jgi:hypothetical protein